MFVVSIKLPKRKRLKKVLKRREVIALCPSKVEVRERPSKCRKKRERCNVNDSHNDLETNSVKDKNEQST